MCGQEGKHWEERVGLVGGGEGRREGNKEVGKGGEKGKDRRRETGKEIKQKKEGRVLIKRPQPNNHSSLLLLLTSQHLIEHENQLLLQLFHHVAIEGRREVQRLGDEERQYMHIT